MIEVTLFHYDRCHTQWRVWTPRAADITIDRALDEIVHGTYGNGEFFIDACHIGDDLIGGYTGPHAQLGPFVYREKVALKATA
jgi:hypothetical protein